MTSPLNPSASRTHDKAATRLSITELGAVADGFTINTKAIQAAIDQLASAGGGTVVVPAGIFVSGAIFLKPSVDLHLEREAVLRCSLDMEHFPKQRTWIEGHWEEAFTPALINAKGCHGLCISGLGTLDGAGRPVWDKFWRSFHADKSFRNLDLLRARLVILEECHEVLVEGITFKDSQFWNLHILRCQKVQVNKASFVVPEDYVQAPSTDGIDIDSSQDVVVSSCHFNVTDDCVALKGAKGPDALEVPDTRPVERVLIKDCDFKRGHHALSLGSEATVVRHVVLENSKVSGAMIVLNFKLRPDTPQHYEDITIRHLSVNNPGALLFAIRPWTQYFDLKGKPAPRSQVKGVSVQNIHGTAKALATVRPNQGQTNIDGISFRNVILQVQDEAIKVDSRVTNVSFEAVEVNGKPVSSST